MGLFEALGLDLRILLAQFINFAVLIFVLYRFLYTPLLEMMAKRRKTIEDGVKRAQEADTILATAKQQAEEIVLTARREVKGILADAQVTAKKLESAIVEKAKQQAKEIVARAEKQSEEERAGTAQRLKGQIADLVALATQKVVEGKLDASADRAFIEQVIEKVGREK